VPNLFLVLAADIDDKPNLTVMIAENLVAEKGLHAGNIIKELAKEVKGRRWRPAVLCHSRRQRYKRTGQRLSQSRTFAG
jgi:alanyl-tRNA synthetase